MAQKPIVRILFALLFTLSPAADGAISGRGELAFDSSVLVAPGVIFEQRIDGGDAPLILSLLKVDLKRKGVRIAAGQANGLVSLKEPDEGRQTVSEIATRERATAAINADFFPYTGDPLGLEIRHGELLSESMDYRVCMGISKGSVKFAVLTTIGSWSSGSMEGRLQGINRLPGASEVTLLTPAFSCETPIPREMDLIPLTSMNLPVKVSKEVSGVAEERISLRTGDRLSQCDKNCAYLAIGLKATTPLRDFTSGEKISILFDLTPTGDPPAIGKYESASPAIGESHSIVWNDIQEAVSGGPWLVKEGKLFIDGEAEKMNRLSFVEMRHPRTAVGVTSNRQLLLVTADGRSKWSRGASLQEMAKIMLRLGAVNAINLDGGGSTTMVVKNQVINAPSDGKERPVANSLLVFTENRKNENPIETFARERTVRQGVSLALDIDLPSSERKSLVWGTEGGFGFVSQTGVFHCDKPGSGKVSAVAAHRSFIFIIKVSP